MVTAVHQEGKTSVFGVFHFDYCLWSYDKYEVKRNDNNEDSENVEKTRRKIRK